MSRVSSEAWRVGDRPGARAGRRRILLAVGCLYMAFGLMTALLQGGLPPILRARGMTMEGIALTFALYLPIGLSFLWAPMVDRWAWPFLSRRIGWIVAAQAVAVAGLLVVAGMEAAALDALFAVGLVVALAVATMDLALDALVVETTGPEMKPLAAALKLAALSSGAMIGGGVFVGLLTHIGWAATFGLVAALMAVAVVPVLGLGAEDRAAAGKSRQEPGDTPGSVRVFRIARRPDMLARLAVLVLIAAVIFPLSALNRVMLVDLGVSLERIGWLVGTVQPMGLLAVSLASAPLIRRLGSRGAFAAFSALCLICLGLMGAGYRLDIPDMAIVGAIGTAGGVGGMFVVLAALMLVWAEGDEVATTYAVLFSGSRLAGIVATVLAGGLVAGLDWVTFYALGAVALVGVTLLLLVGLRPWGEGRPPFSDQSPPSDMSRSGETA